jgi:hypothetical protein
MVCQGGVVTTPYRRVVVNAAAWLAGAAASVAVGIIALSQINDGLGDAGVQPLSPDAVIAVATGQPAADPPVASGGATPSGSATPSGGAVPSGGATPSSGKTPADGATPSADATESPPAAGGKTAAAHDIERVLTSPGGSLVAWCSAGEAYLASWSPAQGYEADDVRRGPATEASLVFQGTQSVVVAVRCVAGVPEASIKQQPADGDDAHGNGD